MEDPKVAPAAEIHASPGDIKNQIIKNVATELKKHWYIKPVPCVGSNASELYSYPAGNDKALYERGTQQVYTSFACMPTSYLAKMVMYKKPVEFSRTNRNTSVQTDNVDVIVYKTEEELAKEPIHIQKQYRAGYLKKYARLGYISDKPYEALKNSANSKRLSRAMVTNPSRAISASDVQSAAQKDPPQDSDSEDNHSDSDTSMCSDIIRQNQTRDEAEEQAIMHESIAKMLRSRNVPRNPVKRGGSNRRVGAAITPKRVKITTKKAKEAVEQAKNRNKKRALVTDVRQLPNLTPEELQRLKQGEGGDDNPCYSSHESDLEDEPLRFHEAFNVAKVLEEADTIEKQKNSASTSNQQSSNNPSTNTPASDPQTETTTTTGSGDVTVTTSTSNVNVNKQVKRWEKLL